MQYRRARDNRRTAASLRGITYDGWGWVYAGSQQRHRRIWGLWGRKHMSLPDDLSATSPDYINDKGFYVSFPPPSSSTSDGTAPSPSQPSGQDTEVHMSRIHEVISVMKVCLSHLLCLGCLSQTIAPDAIVHTTPSMQSTRMREVGFRRSLLCRTGSGSSPSYLFSLNRY
jgi:hypothetical protein